MLELDGPRHVFGDASTPAQAIAASLTSSRVEFRRDMLTSLLPSLSQRRYLAVYEQLSLVVLAAVGVVIWVAAIAVVGALRTRYSRRVNIAASSLLLCGVALALAGQAQHEGIVSPFVFDGILSAARWVVLAAMVFTIVSILWIGYTERVLTTRFASGAVAISAVFGAAWLTVLHMAGVQLAGMSAMNAVLILSPALLPPTVSVLAPWSLNRIRHT